MADSARLAKMGESRRRQQIAAVQHVRDIHAPYFS
jgi:hypothetical protein